LINWITSLLLITGTFFMVTSSIGMLRLPDFFTRLHGPTKAATLGTGCLLLAAVVFFTFGENKFSIREILAIVFVFMTSPVGSHMLSKAARASGVPFHKDTRIEK
jgi:monovalent cation/proton antiporter MnhG/PhaG subunit